ncbi:MAG TPA: porin family protein [Gammaproteobacteria bacterium]
MRYSLVAILCIGLSAPAYAQQRGGYVGLSAGSYRVEDDEPGASVSDSALSYGVFGGYRFSNSFALEGGLGKTTDFENILDNLLFLTSESVVYDFRTVRALGILQRDKLELFAGLGYHDSDAKGELNILGGPDIVLDESDSGMTAAVGLQFDGNQFSYRFQYEWFDASERLDLANFAFGFVIRF